MSALDTLHETLPGVEIEIRCPAMDRQLLETLALPWESIEDCAARFLASAIEHEMAEKSFSGDAKPPFLRVVK